MKFTREKNHSINSCLSIIKRRILTTSKNMQRNQISDEMSYSSSRSKLFSIILSLSLLITYCDSRTITAQDPQIGLRNHPGQPLVSADIQNQNNNQQQQQHPRQKPLISATLQSNPMIINKNPQHQHQQQHQSMPTVISNQFHQSQVLNLNSYKPRQQFNQPIQHHHQHNNHHNSHHHQRAPPVKLNEYCHLPEELVPYTKCTNTLESNFNNTALAEFQSKLDETSSELRKLLNSYWDDFRTLSLDLVLLAKNSTLHKLAQQLITTAGVGASQQVFNQQRYEATKVLFDSIYNHLATSAVASGASLVADFELLNSNSATFQHHNDFTSASASTSTRSSATSIANINYEINAYFRRIYLIQAKKLLDQRLAYSSAGSEVDLECLGGNLVSQTQVETILIELTNYTKSSSNLLSPDLSIEQAKLSQSIKQSIEFTKSLLSSLSLSNEIFNNLTHKSTEWMPHKSCHEALVKMTVCPTCYPIKQSSSRTQTQQAGDIPPCENYCLNVVNGCMNDIYELNRFWSDHVNALTKFKTNLIQMNNIENVMSNLDEKLVNFMIKLNQQYNSSLVVTTTGSSSTSTSIYEQLQQQQQQSQAFDSTSSSSKMIKYCMKSGGQHSGGGGLFRSATAAEHFSKERPSAVKMPATITLPATQKASNVRYGQMALRARLSPVLSLFNQLDSFVYQLQGYKDFFADWPQLLCNKIRKQDNTQNNQKNSSIISHHASRPDSNCWNGHDFSGYSKPLVKFGSAITSTHPEVPMHKTDPFNTMILNFVDKLKIITSQLVRKSAKSPNMLYPALTTSEMFNSNPKSATNLDHYLQDSSAGKTSNTNSNGLDSVGKFFKPGTRDSMNNNSNNNNNPSTANQQQQQQQQQQAENKQTSGQQVVGIPGIGSLDLVVSAASAIEHDEEEPTTTAEGEGSSQDEGLANGNEDDSLASEEGESNEGGDEEDDSEDLVDPYECLTPDCSNIVTVDGNNLNSQLPNNIGGGPSSSSSSTGNDVLIVDPQHHRDKATPLDSIDNSDSVPQVDLTQLDNGRPIPKIPFQNYPPFNPASNNEIHRFHSDLYIASSAIGSLNSTINTLFALGCLLLIAIIFIMSTNKLLSLRPSAVAVVVK